MTQVFFLPTWQKTYANKEDIIFVMLKELDIKDLNVNICFKFQMLYW